MKTGIRLESDVRPVAPCALDDINAVLAPIGARIWHHDWSGLSVELKAFAADPCPSPERAAEVLPHFLLSRERMLEIIAAAGREPHVAGGGELTTVNETFGAKYPQLYVAREGEDYSRFDRLHVNVAADGTPVDNVLQLLSGSGLLVVFRMPSGGIEKLSLCCPAEDSGWLLTLDCAHPFIGTLSSALVGTKVISQAIGPARWRMEHLD